MELHLTLSGSGDLTAQIYAAVRSAVLDGRLRSGEKAPSSRSLADRLGVARGTVTAAYDRLIAEEVLESRRGSGTFVAAGHPLPMAAADVTRPGVVHPSPLWRDLCMKRPSDTAVTATWAADFSVGVPDARLFPFATWRRLVSRVLRHGLVDVDTYDDEGPSRLEVEIARHVGVARSVITTPNDVVSTAGAQQALDLVARVMLERGDVVVVEDPGYAPAARLFASHRAIVRPVPVDAEGLVVDALPDAARLVYVTPSHQFPTGVVMSLARRMALLQRAIGHGALIVEDDYDSEFRFAARPLEPLQALDRDGRVVYLGSFSKSLLPALRMGYAVAPSSLTPALREAKRVTVWDGDLITQSALTDFLAEGHHAAHVRRVMKVYRQRRDITLQTLATFDEHLEILPSVAGLHVCALLRGAAARGGGDISITGKAAQRGIRIQPLSPRYSEPPGRSGLTLGYGAVLAQTIRPALSTLKGVLDDMTRAKARMGA